MSAPLPTPEPGQQFGFYIQLVSNIAAGRPINPEDMDPWLVGRAALHFRDRAPTEKTNWRPELLEEQGVAETFGEYVIRMIRRHGHGVPACVIFARSRAAAVRASKQRKARAEFPQPRQGEEFRAYFRRVVHARGISDQPVAEDPLIVGRMAEAYLAAMGTGGIEPPEVGESPGAYAMRALETWGVQATDAIARYDEFQRQVEPVAQRASEYLKRFTLARKRGQRGPGWARRNLPQN